MDPIRVVAEKCVGCGLCVKACPYDAIAVADGKTAVVDLSRCTVCGACVEACRRHQAIVITKRAFRGQDVKAYSGIAVFAEHRRGKLASVVPEIVGAALALRGQRPPAGSARPAGVAAVLVGKDVRPLAQELLSYGVDEVWMVDNPSIGDFDENVMAEVVADVVSEKKPEIFLGGGTVVGRSLMPRVAARVLTGLTADCTELAIDPETSVLRQTRPAFGGNIMACILTRDHRPQMATVRHKVMDAAPRVENPTGVVVDMGHIKVPASRIEFLEFVEEKTETVNLTDADVIVSGGRGIKDPKNFALLEDLARVTGAALGASRATVDAGWIPYSHQVGQTGKTVKPKIYIACGISGAIQHLAGMKSSDLIIAVNSDPSAPIFDVAQFGIVGDLFEVVPELIKRLKAG